jgi:tetratricopeptide (TPR) repeat protein
LEFDLESHQKVLHYYLPETATAQSPSRGSRAYIVGSISNLGSEYVLGLRAVDCHTNDVLAQEQVTAASKEKVLDAVGQASATLRERLGESLATVQKFDVPLVEATTSSLEALKAFSLGHKISVDKSFPDAVPYFERAIQLDPNFAIAYLSLGNFYFSTGQLAQANEYLSKAYELRERASERERLRIVAFYYLSVTGEQPKAAQAYQLLVQTYSEKEANSYIGLGDAYVAMGQYEQASDAFRQFNRLYPDSCYGNLINVMLALQKFDAARQCVQQAQKRKIEDLITHNAQYALGFLSSDSGAISEQQRWYASQPYYENFGLSLDADTEAYSGHSRKAWELSKRSVKSALQANSRELGAIWSSNLALREAAFGNFIKSREAATDALRLAPSSQAVMVQTALAYAMTGGTTSVESMKKNLNKRYPLDSKRPILTLYPKME